MIKSIQKNNEKKIILSGGIASGKTYLACYLFIKSLIANKKLYSSDTNNFIIGNSKRSVEVNVLGQFEKLCNLLKISYISRHSNNSYILIDSLFVLICMEGTRQVILKDLGVVIRHLFL